MKIKELRKQHGLSQEKLAKDIGLTRYQITRFETGITPIPHEILIKLADYFNVGLDFLCDRQYNNNINHYVPDERKETILKLLSLDDLQFKKIDGYIDAIIDNTK